MRLVGRIAVVALAASSLNACSDGPEEVSRRYLNAIGSGNGAQLARCLTREALSTQASVLRLLADPASPLYAGQALLECGINIDPHLIKHGSDLELCAAYYDGVLRQLRSGQMRTAFDAIANAQVLSIRRTGDHAVVMLRSEQLKLSGSLNLVVDEGSWRVPAPSFSLQPGDTQAKQGRAAP